MRSRPPPEPVTLYLDRNLGGRIVSRVLTDAEVPHERHDDHLPQDAPDEDWIGLCARRGWVGITFDKNIRYRAPEIAAIRAAGACVLVIRAKNTTGHEYGFLLAAHYSRICTWIGRRSPPRVGGIDRNGRITEYLI